MSSMAFVVNLNNKSVFYVDHSYWLHDTIFNKLLDCGNLMQQIREDKDRLVEDDKEGIPTWGTAIYVLTELEKHIHLDLKGVFIVLGEDSYEEFGHVFKDFTIIDVT